MRKALAILAGVILITILAACNLTDMFKGKTADQQSTQNAVPPPAADNPPPAADNQQSPPQPNPPPSNQAYQNTAPSRQAPSSSYPSQQSYAQNAPQDSGYGNQGSYAPRPIYTTAQIDQMVAPVALYPDALMTQVLMASAYPYDVTDADQWLQSNRGLSGAYLDDALATASWDPSVIALCKFPTALDRMAGDIQWTTDLGDAFLNQRSDVMSAVQRLRQEAYRSGHLRTSPQQRVVYDPQYIVIQPYTPNVYYVPYYNPTIVYGSAWNYPNYYYPSVYNPPPSPGYSFVNGFAWGLGVAFGNVLFGGYDWNHRNVYVNNNVFYQNNIYRNTDYYRNRGMYGGRAHGDWAYNAHYNRADEGFVRAPYAGRGHGNVRGLPDGAVRGGRNRTYLETNVSQGPGGGRNRQEGAGQGQRQGQGMGQGQGKRPEGQGMGQGQGQRQGQGMGQGQGKRPEGQGMGQGKGQGQGQGMGQGQGKRPEGQGMGQGKGQGQGQGLGQGQGKRPEGQGLGQGKGQGQGQGLGQGQGKRPEGQGLGQGQGGKNRPADQPKPNKKKDKKPD